MIASVVIVVGVFSVHYLQAVIASVMIVVGLLIVHCSLFAGCDRLCDYRCRFVDCSLVIVHCSLFAGCDRLCDDRCRFVH